MDNSSSESLSDKVQRVGTYLSFLEQGQSRVSIDSFWSEESLSLCLHDLNDGSSIDIQNIKKKNREISDMISIRLTAVAYFTEALSHTKSNLYPTSSISSNSIIQNPEDRIEGPERNKEQIDAPVRRDSESSPPTVRKEWDQFAELKTLLQERRLLLELSRSKINDAEIEHNMLEDELNRIDGVLRGIATESKKVHASCNCNIF